MISPRSAAGFTLIELVVVIAILAILAGMAIPSVIAIEAGEKAKAATTLLDNHAIAISALAADLGRLPTNLAELSANPTNNVQWKGPYLDIPAGQASASVDPWSTTLQYVQVDAKTARITCAGPNQAFGGAVADDIVRDVPISQELRVRTRFTVDRVNLAINAYNALYLPSQPLTGNIDNAVATLQARSLLPGGFNWTIDAFGAKLQTSASPITYVISTSN